MIRISYHPAALKIIDFRYSGIPVSYNFRLKNNHKITTRA